MRFSLRFNNDMPATRFARLAALAEDSGFDQIWVSNDLFFQSAAVLIAAAATDTKRIALGAGVFNPVSMRAPEIAMVAASLNELSGGRFRLGLGAGADRFLAWAGLDRAPPVVRARAALRELRDLFAGRTPEGFSPAARLWAAPVEIPLYVGAMGRRMLELAGELADGALPLLFPPEHFRAARRHVADGAARAGRDLTGLDIAACVWCSIADDAAAARRAMAAKIAYYGPSFAPELLKRAGLSTAHFAAIEDALAAGQPNLAADLVTPEMLGLGIVGNAEAVLARCMSLVSAGADHISFGPPLGPDPERSIVTLGRAVVPVLRAAGRNEYDTLDI